LSHLKKDLIFVAHDKEEKDGDDTILRPDISGSNYQMLKRNVDLIGYLNMENGKRTLNFSPTNRTVGKNCANLPKYIIPNEDEVAFETFLADLIKDVKIKLNEESHAQKASSEVLKDYKSQIEKATNPVDFDNLLDQLNALKNHAHSKSLKIVLAAKAESLNMEYVKDLGKFRMKSEDRDQIKADQAKENKQEKASEVVASVKKTKNK
jgi:hypothetical protein